MYYSPENKDVSVNFSRSALYLFYLNCLKNVKYKKQNKKNFHV